MNREYINYDYIFIHAMNFSCKQLLKLNKKVYKKIIWCVWGHDLYFNNECNNIVSKSREKIKKKIIKYLLESIYAVGIGFGYDSIEVRKIVGDKPKIKFLPYGYEKGAIEKYQKVFNKIKQNSNECKIMIGHSGFEFLNHIEILKKLLKYKDEKIIISLVFSYGENSHMESVKKFVFDNFDSKKIEIINNMMNDEEYMNYLNTVDIAIFDFKHQAALGNMWKLSYLGKKIYLNDDGILKMAFDLEGLDSYNISEISSMNFNEFSRTIEHDEKIKLHRYGERYLNENNVKNAWKKMFKNLENEGL